LELWHIFQDIYQALDKHAKFEGFSFNTDMFRGAWTASTLSPLAAFWGSVQAMVGDVQGAMRTHTYWTALWSQNSALPEVLDVNNIMGMAMSPARDCPLRPELFETTFYLHQATGDFFYVNVTNSFADAINSFSRVKCGFAAIADVGTKRLDDRMDSFFVSETLPYLYLTAHPEALGRLPYQDFVFSTEGHAFPLFHAVGGYARLPHSANQLQRLFPVSQFRPILRCPKLGVIDRMVMHARRDMVFVPKVAERPLHPVMSCATPWASAIMVTGPENDPHISVLSALAAAFGRALKPLHDGIGAVSAATLATCGSDGTQCPSIEEPSVHPIAASGQDFASSASCQGVTTRQAFASSVRYPRLEMMAANGRRQYDIATGLWLPPHRSTGYRLRVGRERPIPSAAHYAMNDFLFASPLPAASGRRVVVAHPATGCSQLKVPSDQRGTSTRAQYYEGKVVIVTRGDCLFLTKAHNAQSAGASAVIVRNHVGQKDQVATCPFADGIGGMDVHIEVLMMSAVSVDKIQQALDTQGQENVALHIFAEPRAHRLQGG